MKRLTKIVLVAVFGLVLAGAGVGLSYVAAQHQPLSEEPASWI